MNREHLLKALAKGVRYDGRKLDEYRPVKVEKMFRTALKAVLRSPSEQPK